MGTDSGVDVKRTLLAENKMGLSSRTQAYAAKRALTFSKSLANKSESHNMNRYLSHGDFFGAIACISIEFDGTLEHLAAKLAIALNLKSFTVEASEDPPFKLIGSAEAMGWEAWLEEKSDDHFILRIETELSLKESFHGKMHDLSPWFARLITTLCEVSAQPSGSLLPN